MHLLPLVLDTTPFTVHSVSSCVLWRSSAAEKHWHLTLQSHTRKVGTCLLSLWHTLHKPYTIITLHSLWKHRLTTSVLYVLFDKNIWIYTSDILLLRTSVGCYDDDVVALVSKLLKFQAILLLCAFLTSFLQSFNCITKDLFVAWKTKVDCQLIFDPAAGNARVNKICIKS